MGNQLHIDIHGKVVVNQEDAQSPNFRELKHRLFFAMVGFGCKADTYGGKVFGVYLFDGEDSFIRGETIERLATNDEIFSISVPVTVDFKKQLAGKRLDYINRLTAVGDDRVVLKYQGMQDGFARYNGVLPIGFVTCLVEDNNIEGSQLEPYAERVFINAEDRAKIHAYFLEKYGSRIISTS